MRYQRVFTQVWNDEKFLALSPEGQRFFLYLLTNPNSNLIGFYILKEGYACVDLKIKPTDFVRLLKEVEPFIFYDRQNHLVLIKNYLHHNPLANPNQVKSGIELLNSYPKTSLLKEFRKILETLPEGITKRLLNASSLCSETVDAESGNGSETVSKPFRNPSESESESESVRGVQGGKKPRPSKKAPADFQVTEEMRSWAIAEGLPAAFVDSETAKFRDHTFAAPRTDWEGTWRNWVRRAIELRGGPEFFEKKPAWCVGALCGEFKKEKSDACHTTCAARPKEAVHA